MLKRIIIQEYIMQADLSYYSHTIECNFLIERLQRCYNDHFFGLFLNLSISITRFSLWIRLKKTELNTWVLNFLGKFLGYCDKMASDVAHCCHEERVLKRFYLAMNQLFLCFVTILLVFLDPAVFSRFYGLIDAFFWGKITHDILRVKQTGFLVCQKVRIRLLWRS